MREICGYTRGSSLGCGTECEREATHVAIVRPHLAGPLQTEEMLVCGKCATAIKNIYGAEIRRIT